VHGRLPLPLSLMATELGLCCYMCDVPNLSKIGQKLRYRYRGRWGIAERSDAQTDIHSSDSISDQLIIRLSNAMNCVGRAQSQSYAVKVLCHLAV